MEGEMEDGGHIVITSGSCMPFCQHCHVVVGGFVCDWLGVDLQIIKRREKAEGEQENVL